jgi:hypothetical protein
MNDPQINEHLWQKWIWKNRELDKVAARKRVRFLQVVLLLVVAAAVFQSIAK